MATHWTLGCDAADPQRLAAFWAQGRGPAIGFLRVPEGKTAENRVHIDLRVAAGWSSWSPPGPRRCARSTPTGHSATW